MSHRKAEVRILNCSGMHKITLSLGPLWGCTLGADVLLGSEHMDEHQHVCGFCFPGRVLQVLLGGQGKFQLWAAYADHQHMVEVPVVLLLALAPSHAYTSGVVFQNGLKSLVDLSIILSHLTDIQGKDCQVGWSFIRPTKCWDFSFEPLPLTQEQIVFSLVLM